MKKTTNYNLNKPDGTDFYNISNQNDNMDIIDGKLKSNSDAIGTISNLNAGGKKNLVDAVNSCFQSASDGKTLVANAVTGKGIPTSNMDTFATIAENIGSIEIGVDTSDATADATQILKYQTAYVNGSKVTGTMEDFSNGLITCDGIFKLEREGNLNYSKLLASVSADYHYYGGYFDYTSIIECPVSGLIPENIKSGVVIAERMVGTYYGNAAYFTGTANTTDVEVYATNGYGSFSTFTLGVFTVAVNLPSIPTALWVVTTNAGSPDQDSYPNRCFYCPENSSAEWVLQSNKDSFRSITRHDALSAGYTVSSNMLTIPIDTYGGTSEGTLRYKIYAMM